MVRILITDAEGLVGKFTINELISQLRDTISSSADSSRILAGYHSQKALQRAVELNQDQKLVKPVIIDWADSTSFITALQEVDRILLITPFTSAKTAQIK
ncbi:uncharacterized protein N7496_011073 [Penicillium cataractarum]|uniref:Uncharacterized protein n=1 Tax=Penicillium cataractarum TaxID=2100454 RepID=A0A9W9UXD9_9EURO|nr:uncharacterized protein N7496_011073 [Penicillium cataractarum]KAJ5358660.1 hypothetical protein N7496_011073 [Penicillium cataractarum]